MDFQTILIRTLFLATALTTFVLGCASTPGAKPEDMSAKSHEEAAQAEVAKADKHESKYDPNAPGTAAAEVVAGSDFGFAGTQSNPTDVHIAQAEKHRKHADDHLAAAETLRRAEEKACESIPAEARASCPLLGPVVATENTAKGVRISLSESTEVEALTTRIRCHLAFANTRGREGMDRCPLYVRDVQVRQSGPSSIELSTKGKANIRELQRRVAEHTGD